MEDEVIELEKPFKLNGYEITNTQELRDLFECDVITFYIYDKILDQIKNGKIGVKKKRKHYKELYEKNKQMLYRLRLDYYAVANVVNEIEKLTNDEQILALISTLR